MARRALIEHRPWLLAAISCAIAYFFMRSGDVDEYPIIVLKGSGAAFLAVYAWQRGSGVSAGLLTGAMALSSLGDMTIEFDLIWGGGCFLAAHLVAIVLYLKNRRDYLSHTQIGAALALLVLAPLVAWWLTGDPLICAYATVLGAMAAAAWTSRFSRYRVGTGVILFVISDWLIFWNIGSEDPRSVTSLLIWPLYFIGQFLIATGIIQTLRRGGAT